MKYQPRYELGRHVQERLTFVGSFEKFGTKPGHAKRPVTILLLSITHGSTVVTDHLWLNRTKGFDAMRLRRGDRVQFDARVKTYRKGNGKLDYKLSYPTKVIRLAK